MIDLLANVLFLPSVEGLFANLALWINSTTGTPTSA
jgi:hypothetical protein